MHCKERANSNNVRNKNQNWCVHRTRPIVSMLSAANHAAHNNKIHNSKTIIVLQLIGFKLCDYNVSNETERREEKKTKSNPSSFIVNVSRFVFFILVVHKRWSVSMFARLAGNVLLFQLHIFFHDIMSEWASVCLTNSFSLICKSAILSFCESFVSMHLFSTDLEARATALQPYHTSFPWYVIEFSGSYHTQTLKHTHKMLFTHIPLEADFNRQLNYCFRFCFYYSSRSCVLLYKPK